MLLGLIYKIIHKCLSTIPRKGSTIAIDTQLETVDLEDIVRSCRNARITGKIRSTCYRNSGYRYTNATITPGEWRN